MHASQDYAAIFLDCQLPDVSGFEVAAQIRARETGTRHTRIIAMTANAASSDRERCLAAGMDDYLEKPVRTASLDAAIEDLNATTTSGHRSRPPAGARSPRRPAGRSASRNP